MTLQPETGGGEVPQFSRTSGDLEDTRAGAAPEMVVVRAAGTLITGWLTGQFHGNEPPALHESIDGPIHRGDAELGDTTPARFEDFDRPEGPRDLFENAPDGVPLFRIAFHPSNMAFTHVDPSGA